MVIITPVIITVKLQFVIIVNRVSQKANINTAKPGGNETKNFRSHGIKNLIPFLTMTIIRSTSDLNLKIIVTFCPIDECQEEPTAHRQAYNVQP